MPRRGMRTYPMHGPKSGKGARIDDASGFLRHADDVVEDRRQGYTSKDHADITPGFGTFHPQDLKRLSPKPDPRAIPRARTDSPEAVSAKDMGYTDAEVRESIRKGIPLRPKE